MRKNVREPPDCHDGLPEKCYTVLPYSGKLVVLKRGVRAYYMCSDQSSSAAKNRRTAIFENRNLEVSKAQEAAMIFGSKYGFSHPEADPNNYDKRGRLLPCINHKATDFKNN